VKDTHVINRHGLVEDAQVARHRGYAFFLLDLLYKDQVKDADEEKKNMGTIDTREDTVSIMVGGVEAM
jgi:hypothetical protein